MKATRAFAATLLAFAAIGVAGWFGWSVFGPESTEGTERELTYRNVSITLPSEDSGRSGYIVIDAATGEVLVDTIGGDLRDKADDVIASIRQDEDDAGVWPLADVPPPDTRTKFGNMSYIEPDPSSGIFVAPQEWDGDNSSGVALFFHNGESRMLIDGNSGKVEVDLVLPRDREAFDRVAAAVRVEPTP